MYRRCNSETSLPVFAPGFVGTLAMTSTSLRLCLFFPVWKQGRDYHTDSLGDRDLGDENLAYVFVGIQP
jgi:hypothetical protein